MARTNLAGLIAALTIVVAPPVAAQAPERLLTYGVTGSVTSQGYDNPTVLLGRIEVQRTVLAAARDGIDDAQARALLSVGGDVTPAHLVNAGILRREGEHYRIAFNLVTAEDRARIDVVLAPYVHSLADAVLRRRGRLEALFAR
ncbi:MAG TPA: hypothetical protein VFO00_02665, partial [Vitreimonas sp.]|nr:hypothetical protein [Vitreimonas sp.]